MKFLITKIVIAFFAFATVGSSGSLVTSQSCRDAIQFCRQCHIVGQDPEGPIGPLGDQVPK